MTAGVSVTAQRVAAARLTFDRATVPYGDGGADDALARDVAASTRASSAMRTYLEARTRFFDRIVVGALDAGMSQVVVGAAGYDGRALRYAKPAVRWFEVDHPATQRDKRARLERLGLDAAHITFVEADFTVDPVDRRVVEAGLDPHLPALFLLEGVAVYLEQEVLESLLRHVRSVAAAGSRLAVSLSVDARSPERVARRARFEAGVAALGEPARSTVPPEDVDALLTATGWHALPVGDGRAASAGFVLAEPAPAA